MPIHVRFSLLGCIAKHAIYNILNYHPVECYQLSRMKELAKPNLLCANKSDDNLNSIKDLADLNIAYFF